ncbi:hypothetical protein H7J88_05750 [Mycolicibacterium flavescens]|uniref:hypothetical protein n=1 Tax=Mycolicibacterium flavescens TaxID=1776 RepID=UPI0013F4C9A1|nr:hypothetical protein [Mycolicibacterium flavescens]MCV7279149.1 hypothetical protein [Mycolicibacterium flavescens]
MTLTRQRPSVGYRLVTGDGTEAAQTRLGLWLRDSSFRADDGDTARCESALPV